MSQPSRVLNPQHNHQPSVTSFNDDNRPIDLNASWSTGETTLDPRYSGPERNAMQRANSEREVAHLALQLSTQSTQFSPEDDLENPFLWTKDESTLNPRCPAFKASDWMKNMLALTARDPIRYPGRAAGISFRNISVHGFGSPTDYQKDVFNSVLQLGQLVRLATGEGRQKQKLQILRDFDGLVKSGEMLMVLGRPGRYVVLLPFHCILKEMLKFVRSGCSTLLKTLAGEMNGICMDDTSHLNYQGTDSLYKEDSGSDD